MSFAQSDLVEVKRVTGKGRGVFARRFIPAGTVIETVPVLSLPAEDVQATPLAGFCFLWGRDTVALPLGYGALYNHSYDPNAEYLDRAQLTKSFRALRDIPAGEEITINYNGDQCDDSDVGFPVI